MSILQPILFFIGGMSVLLMSSQMLLRVTRSLAIRWKISPLILALVILALGTNIPELAFTMSVFFGADPGLAIGNIIGSNIANMLLVFGVGILLGKPRIGSDKTPKNALMMLSVTLLFMVVRSAGFPFLWQGLLLLTATTLIIIYQYFSAAVSKTSDSKYLYDVAKPKKSSRDLQKLPLVFLGFIVLGSVIGVLTGSYLVTSGVQAIATMIGISQTVFGLTLVAVTTSMPELITISLAGLNHDDKAMVGTIIGSNIYNLGLFAGILLLNQTQTYISQIDSLFLVVSTFFFTFLLLFHAKQKVHRAWGAVMIVMFLLFVAQAFILQLL